MQADGLFALLARAVGDLKDAVLITEGERGADGMRRIIFVNPAFSAMTGFAADEAVGSLPDITVGPETSREALREIQAARDALVPVRVELLKYRKDRSTFWAELDVVPIVDGCGRCTHFIGVMRDISERRASHERLVETERLAALGTLAAGIAHEVNNPLAFITMNLGFLEEELPGLGAGEDAAAAKRDELLRAVAEIREGVDRIGKIVRDVRAFSQVDQDRGRPCELHTVLDRSVQMAQLGLPIGVHVERSYGELPPVFGHATRLAQVFLNILINAIDAIPPDAVDRRGIEIRAFDRGEHVVVEVEDQGTGIPPEVLPRVFDPFFSTKPPGRGSGLGLSVSLGVVRSFGGEMTIETKANVGTIVRVALKKTDGAAEDVDGAAAAPASGRLRILVVDDEPMIARSIRRALAAQHDIVICQSAKAALDELASDREFHVVLSDLSMPGMGGAELYAEIARRWPGLEKRMIVMTGGACTDGGRDFLAKALTPRFDKPLDLPALRRALERFATTKT